MVKSVEIPSFDLHTATPCETTCLYCKYRLYDEICDNCGEKSSICEACKLGFNEKDVISTCPECNFIFHFSHFRAAIRIYGVCPVCRSRISFRKIEGQFLI